jgi:hypothetical protein
MPKKSLSREILPTVAMAYGLIEFVLTVNTAEAQFGSIFGLIVFGLGAVILLTGRMGR